jgi:aldehyde dehydrogenase (NAD+)
LTASVFGPERKARAFADRIHAGTVLINDVLVSSADPRVSFSGRGMSGFGATRGATGLLEMTAIKSVIVQRSRSRRAWQPTTDAHAGFFAAFLCCVHGKGWRSRLKGLLSLVTSARRLNS